MEKKEKISTKLYRKDLGMKQRFTLIELLVVIVIIVMMPPAMISCVPWRNRLHDIL